jgi:hypothetical protein
MAESKVEVSKRGLLGGLGEMVSRKRYGEAIMLIFQGLESGQIPLPGPTEDDLVFCMNEFTTQLRQGGNESNATWLWMKCLELCADRSPLVLYSYSR